MDPKPLLQRILTKPSAADLISMQSWLLSREEKADSPEMRAHVGAALLLLENFYSYLVCLESKMEARAFAELASKMDMAAVGVVVAENVRGAGERIVEKVLMGTLGEALMVLASRQYVKAFHRDLESFCRQITWQLRAHLWRFSANRRPGIPAQDRAEMINALFAPIMAETAPGAAKPVVLGCLFQILLLASIAEILPE
jgi:hypothetical protein